MSSIGTEVGSHLPDMGGYRRVRQEIGALSVQTVRPLRLTIIVGGGLDNTSLCISPKNGEECVVQRPAGHRQLPDDC